MSELLYINGSGTNYYGQTRISQSFIPTDDWEVTDIWVDAIWVSSDTNVTVQIYEDNGGDPNDGSLIATSNSIALYQVPIPATFDFPTIPSLTNGQKYHLVYVPFAGQVYWYRTDTSIYADGGTQYSTNGGSTWTNNENIYDQRQLKIIGVISTINEAYLDGVSFRGVKIR